jgi:hypothetical protein
MARVYLLTDGPGIVRRRPLVPLGQVVEAWPDVYVPGEFWVSEESKALLDAAGPPLVPRLSVDADAVRVYYGPHLRDEASLPTEGSLRARVLSAHGVAVAWITLDAWGERRTAATEEPAHPVFHLRRPRGRAAHLWRLFRERPEAVAYLGEHYGKDAEAREWAAALPVRDFEELLSRHAVPG